MDNYTNLVDRISNSAGVEKEEIERRIEAKRAKLSGLVSKEGAAQIVAAELGISFENAVMKISELVHGMKRVKVVGQVTRTFPIKEYNKNGREGKIGSFLLGDDSSNTRVVLWDTNHIALIENGDLKAGDVVEISNGLVRNGEIHLSAFSDVKKSNQKIEGVRQDRIFELGKLREASPGKNMKIRAVIVQVFEPRFFKSKKEGDSGEERALLNVVLDDGSETIRAVIFGEQINKLGLSNEEIFSLEKFIEKKSDLLGEEKLFAGNFRTNSFFNNLEMNIEGIEDVNVNNLIKEMESKL